MYNPDGTIHQHKARLVVQGFSQIYMSNYKETFSHVVHLNDTY